jgi:uncharacterized protein YjbJ (UPF0337 family)
MNSDVFKGQWKQLKGKVQQQWGRLTDDDLAEINGDRDLLIGKLQELYGRSREDAEKDLDRWATISEMQAGVPR